LIVVNHKLATAADYATHSSHVFTTQDANTSRMKWNISSHYYVQLAANFFTVKAVQVS